MKKKLFCMLTIALLVCTFSATAHADGVLNPVIYSVSPDVDVTDSSIPVLKVNAVSTDGGVLDYIWYSASEPDLSLIMAESTSVSRPEFVPTQTQGTRYYCVGISNVLNGEYSEWVYSDFIRVSFAESEAEYVESLEIIQTPEKWEYTEGETIDLSGLIVRVHTNKGYWDSHDGSGLDYSEAPLSTIGDQEFRISCDGAENIIWIYVSPIHTSHSYGEWKTETKATCAQQGLEVRECSCGLTEERVVKKLDHDWDEGTVKVQPSETKPGTKVFTCKLCNATKSETIMPTGKENKPSPSVTVKPAQTPSVQQTPGSDNIDSAGQQAPGNSNNVTDAVQDNEANLWMLAVIMFGVLALGAGVGFVLLQRRKTR